MGRVIKELVTQGHELVALLGTQHGMHDAASLVQRLTAQLDITAVALREMTRKRDAEHDDVLTWEKTMFKACGEDGHKSVAAKFVDLEAKCAALAAENGQMLRLLTDISENHDEYVNQDDYLYAGIPMDYVSEINAYVSRDVEAENPFKETDAFLAEVRAQGVEMFGDHLRKKGSNPIVCKMIALGADEFAAQLRQDANTEELVAAGIITKVGE